MTVRLVSPAEANVSRLTVVAQNLAQGRSNANGLVTLTASAASTVVTAPNCSSESAVFLSPTTANASAEQGAGTIYISAVANGSFTIAHANNAQADRTYHYVCIG